MHIFSINSRNFHISASEHSATLYEHCSFWANHDETRSYESFIHRGVFKPTFGISAYEMARHASVVIAKYKNDKTPISVYDISGKRVGTINPLTCEYIDSATRVASNPAHPSVIHNLHLRLRR